MCVVVCITSVVTRDGRNPIWWTECASVYGGHRHALHLHWLKLIGTSGISILLLNVTPRAVSLLYMDIVHIFNLHVNFHNNYYKNWKYTC